MFLIRILMIFSLFVSANQPAMASSQFQLSRMETRVREAVLQGDVPVLIFDLDETLIDSTPRKYMAFRESMKVHCENGSIWDEEGCAEAELVGLDILYSLSNRYAVMDVFNPLLVSQEWMINFEHLMLDIYLSGQGLHLDREIPGAVAFVQKMRALGAKLYFVSSRNDSTQRSGTLSNLRALGFGSPTLEQELILKPEGMRSLEFKKTIFAMIHQSAGEVVGVFENEPENINVMIDEFPGALPYFIRGAFLVDVPVSERAMHLTDFYYF